MYGKRFQLWSKLGVYTAITVLVAVTLIGTIAPASPTLERTKREVQWNEPIWAPTYDSESAPVEFEAIPVESWPSSNYRLID